MAQFLADMALLHAHTGDSHFSVILVDFESEDMDVEQALRAARLPRYRRPALPPPGGPGTASLLGRCVFLPPGIRTCSLAPRYQYLRRTGNFERSAGLQAGVDAVEVRGQDGAGGWNEMLAEVGTQLKEDRAEGGSLISPRPPGCQQHRFSL